MRRRVILDIGLAMLVVGLGALIVGQAERPAAQAPSRTGRLNLPPLPKGPIVYPAIPLQRPQGGPAIRPTRPGEMPAFTSDDVRNFFNSTPGALGGKGKPKATISRIDCSLTAGKVSATILHGRNTGLPDDLAVCYVELTGTFTYSGPASPRSPRGTTLTFPNAFRVFDAKTGNLMLSGALREPSSQ